MVWVSTRAFNRDAAQHANGADAPLNSVSAWLISTFCGLVVIGGYLMAASDNQRGPKSSRPAGASTFAMLSIGRSATG